MSPDKVGLDENNQQDDYEKSFQEATRELEDFVDIPIRLNVLIGKKLVTLNELLNLEPGYLLELNRSAGESLLIYLEDTFFAKGEVTILEDTFAVRITEINDPRQV
ncbi:MAG: FliM/FliN family flagellar motor switch protein [Candidatus Aminicenantes bacterium]|jgi:flagellar motor switch protein FliN/FliY